MTETESNRHPKPSAATHAPVMADPAANQVVGELGSAARSPGPREDEAAKHGLCNIASCLLDMAACVPGQQAVVVSRGRDRQARTRYFHWTFQELNEQSDRYAHGLVKAGIARGNRVLLMVRPGCKFIGLTFALFKLGAVPILIDPGMGRKNLLACIGDVEPQAMVAIPLAHALRVFAGGRFPKIGVRVTVGRRWFWGGETLAKITPAQWTAFPVAPTLATDPAAIIFTTGSTGAPKGVVYEHGMFAAQVEELRDFYDIQPGEVDVAAFPLFALFNVALGVTTVIPDMDPTRPADVDPTTFVQTIFDHHATQSFASPAVWRRVGPYCVERGIKLASLGRILMAGAPVRPEVLDAIQQTLVDGAAHTPYGATEALPVASIDSLEVLRDTANKTREGAGVCVGRPFPRMTVRIIPITDGPIEQWSEELPLPTGEIGEIVVKGPVVTRDYYRRPEATRLAKVPDGAGHWHRMGDAGYLDGQGRIWFCGRVAHRVQTSFGPMYSVCCEAIFHQHPRVARAALVGIGHAPNQTPVIIIEPKPDAAVRNARDRERFAAELLELGAKNNLTASIRQVLFHRRFPVDIRHNAKIFREQLAVWAERRLRA